MLPPVEDVSDPLNQEQFNSDEPLPVVPEVSTEVLPENEHSTLSLDRHLLSRRRFIGAVVAGASALVGIGGAKTGHAQTQPVGDPIPTFPEKTFIPIVKNEDHRYASLNPIIRGVQDTYKRSDDDESVREVKVTVKFMRNGESTLVGDKDLSVNERIAVGVIGGAVIKVAKLANDIRRVASEFGFSDSDLQKYRPDQVDFVIVTDSERATTHMHNHDHMGRPRLIQVLPGGTTRTAYAEWYHYAFPLFHEHTRFDQNGNALNPFILQRNHVWAEAASNIADPRTNRNSRYFQYGDTQCRDGSLGGFGLMSKASGLVSNQLWIPSNPPIPSQSYDYFMEKDALEIIRVMAEYLPILGDTFTKEQILDDDSLRTEMAKAIIFLQLLKPVVFGKYKYTDGDDNNSNLIKYLERLNDPNYIGLYYRLINDRYISEIKPEEIEALKAGVILMDANFAIGGEPDVEPIWHKWYMRFIGVQLTEQRENGSGTGTVGVFQAGLTNELLDIKAEEGDQVWAEVERAPGQVDWVNITNHHDTTFSPLDAVEGRPYHTTWLLTTPFKYSDEQHPEQRIYRVVLKKKIKHPITGAIMTVERQLIAG